MGCRSFPSYRASHYILYSILHSAFKGTVTCSAHLNQHCAPLKRMQCWNFGPRFFTKPWTILAKATEISSLGGCSQLLRKCVQMHRGLCSAVQHRQEQPEIRKALVLLTSPAEQHCCCPAGCLARAFYTGELLPRCSSENWTFPLCKVRLPVRALCSN